MHLAILQHTDLLPRSCQPLLTLPQVSEAVVTQGRERPLARALATACERGPVRVVAMTDPSLIDHGRQIPSDSPPVSDVALPGVAPALAQQVTLLTDDNGVRMLALAHHVPVIGRIGIVIRARLEGVMAAVHPVLDQRIAAGFPVEPQGHVACEAFQLAGED